MCKEKPFNRQDQKYPDLPDYEFIPLVYPGVLRIYMRLIKNLKLEINTLNNY